MTLISLLITLFLDRVVHAHREGRVAGWLRCYAARASRSLPASWSGVAAVLAVVLPPAIGVGVIQWLLAYWLFGVVYLVLAVAVLLYSLGPLDVADLSEDYIDARRAEDPERADWFYQQLAGEAPPSDPAEEGRTLAAAVLYQANDHLFATIFWFCVLGPAGALLYRVAAQLALAPSEHAGEAYTRSARFVCGVLGWIPARLIAFSYALTGRLDKALSAMGGGAYSNGDVVALNRQLLAKVGTAALRQAESPSGEIGEADQRSHDSAAAVAAARSLATRAAILWLAVIAVLTLVGWLA